MDLREHVEQRVVLGRREIQSVRDTATIHAEEESFLPRWGRGGEEHRTGSRIADGEQTSSIGIQGRLEEAVKFCGQVFGEDFGLKVFFKDKGMEALEEDGAFK